jgi:hypothetical protein
VRRPPAAAAPVELLGATPPAADGDARVIEGGRAGATPGQDPASATPDGGDSKRNTRRRRARTGQVRISVALSKVAHIRLQHRAEVLNVSVSLVAGELIQAELDRSRSEQSEPPVVPPTPTPDRSR